jgi:hypothetical protein
MLYTKAYILYSQSVVGYICIHGWWTTTKTKYVHYNLPNLFHHIFCLNSFMHSKFDFTFIDYLSWLLQVLAWKVVTPNVRYDWVQFGLGNILTKFDGNYGNEDITKTFIRWPTIVYTVL